MASPEGNLETFHLIVERLLGLLHEAGVESAIIGGLAASVLSESRLTHDIDAVTTANNESYPAILAAASRHGFGHREPASDAFIKASRMILLADIETGVTVDLSMAGLAFEFEVIQRAAKAPVAPGAPPVATAEDLLIMKSVAKRPKDLEDIRQILRVQERLDLRRVRRYLKEFAEALDDPEVVGSFERIYAEVRGSGGGGKWRS